MKRHKRRKATAAELKRLGLPKGSSLDMEDVDLNDPNLSAEHRDNFIAAMRSATAEMDEIIGRWYRRPVCQIDGCDCGYSKLAKQMDDLCSHLWFINHKFNTPLLSDYPNARRFIKEFGVVDLYEDLTSANLH